VAHFFLFGLEVSSVVRICSGSDRELLHDFDIVGFEADDLAGVVGKKTDFVDAEIGEDLGTEAVVAKVHGEPKAFIGLHGVEALLLEFEDGMKNFTLTEIKKIIEEIK
jgi:hypothetical protein